MSEIDWRGLCEEPEVVELSDESVEAAAQVIYGSMRFDRVDSTSDWVPNGNSFAQDEARRCAHAVLARWLSSERGERMLGDPACLAAALRALADQMVPESSCNTRTDRGRQRTAFRRDLLAIAAELEGSA